MEDIVVVAGRVCTNRRACLRWPSRRMVGGVEFTRSACCRGNVGFELGSLASWKAARRSWLRAARMKMTYLIFASQR